MKTLLLTLILTACTPITHLNDPPYASDGEAECIVMSECMAAWNNEDRQPICNCLESYKNLDAECTRYFQRLTACLLERACSLLDCSLQFKLETINKCGNQYYE